VFLLKTCGIGFIVDGILKFIQGFSTDIKKKEGKII
jgi:hypothetical protein